jgi:hypothetical protein
MAQAGVESAFEGKRVVPNVRQTHAGFSAAVTDEEMGAPKRKTTHLADAQRHTTRGRVIAVSRRLSDEAPKAAQLVIEYLYNTAAFQGVVFDILTLDSPLILQLFSTHTAALLTCYQFVSIPGFTSQQSQQQQHEDIDEHLLSLGRLVSSL